MALVCGSEGLKEATDLPVYSGVVVSKSLCARISFRQRIASSDRQRPVRPEQVSAAGGLRFRIPGQVFSRRDYDATDAGNEPISAYTGTRSSLDRSSVALPSMRSRSSPLIPPILGSSVVAVKSALAA